MKRYKIFKLMFNVAYSCNMSCDGCVSISNIPRKGVPDFNDTMRSIQDWSQVLDTDWVVPFGGEPLLHPKIEEILVEFRRCWPKTKISLCTNGLLLRKLINKELLEQIKPVEIRVSLHKDDDQGRFFKPLVKELMSLYTGWKYTQIDFKDGDITGLPADHKTPHLFSCTTQGITVSVARETEWVVPYTRNNAGRIVPYNNDPAESYKRCVSEELPVIFDNKLYRCVPYPNLENAIEYFKELWPEYTPYQAHEDLTQYFAETKLPHAICSMCPTFADPTLDHSKTSTVRILPSEKWIQKQIKINT
jgi:hypothetical protein